MRGQTIYLGDHEEYVVNQGFPGQSTQTDEWNGNDLYTRQREVWSHSSFGAISLYGRVKQSFDSSPRGSTKCTPVKSVSVSPNTKKESSGWQKDGEETGAEVPAAASMNFGRPSKTR